MSENVSEMIVNPICLGAFQRAFSGGSPSRCSAQCSPIITMASSTTKP